MEDITVESTAENQILLQLFDNYVPLLDPGDYTIRAELTAQNAGESGQDLGEYFELAPQIFTVTGPRFTLPANDVHAIYPPVGATGRFDQALPHIVLNKRMIPWERNIWGKGEHTVPWLALLVLDRSEILDAEVTSSTGKNPTGRYPISIHDLLNPEDADIAKPKITETSVTAEHLDPNSKCQVIDISPDTFKKVMPDKVHLPYFAHSRKVSIVAKADNRGLHPDRDDEDDSQAWYSVVIASRFPAPQAPGGEKPEDNVVHLVSLEGYADYFNGPATYSFGDAKRVRLVSLYAWPFRCLPDQDASFAGLMQGLVKRTADGDYKRADDLLLRVPIEGETAVADDDKAAVQALAYLRDGYNPMGYQTRQGEKSFGWYRGPLTPELPKPLPADRPTPFLRASQAMIYDQKYGVFDLSYGAAFEAGRMMALSSRSFGVNLLNWRRQVQRMIDLMLERTALHDELKGLIETGEGSAAVRQLLEQGLVTKSFLSKLTSSFTTEVMPNVQGEILTAPDISQIRPEPSGANTGILDDLRSFFGGKDIYDLMDRIDDDVLAPVVRWLGRLALLYDLPFNYLVPDERILPLESVRFFYLDRNWLRALIEGALSIGVHHSRDELFSLITREIIVDATLDVVHAFRDAALGITDARPSDRGSGAYAGMLLRSTAVDGWPGMEVHAYSSHKMDPEFTDPEEMMAQTADEPMKLLRFSRLSDTVLLCLFPATPAWIEIDQPKEGLHFEVQRSANQSSSGSELVIYPRYVSGKKTGVIMQAEANQIVVSMNEDSRLLAFGSGEDGLLHKIKTSLALDQLPGPAAFAMQMIYTPQSMVFQNSLFRPDHKG